MSGSIDAVYAIELFNEKAEKLSTMRFPRAILSENCGVEISFERQASPNWSIDVRAQRVDDEAVESLALTIRFFVQDNEPCSIRNLSKIYGSRILLPLSERFLQLRDYLQAHLEMEAQPQPREGFEGRTMINNDIFQVFLYGGLAHANPVKRRHYLAWRSSEIAWACYSHTFQMVLNILVNTVKEIAVLNKQAIDILSAQRAD